ncbi:protein amnionless [Genypterus blacodes]|uniref:protein amnionless n=1 Tax=Genypterus blacodes TaxID=154954 RepID=UPI003F76E881
MLRTADMLLLFCLVGSASALYKQWIPDTNYENKTNWDKGSVPCGNDIAQFPAQSSVSVYVETMHSVREMRLPVNGEFIFNSGAGFSVVDVEDPGCGEGVTAQFKGSAPLQWFNPALWQVAATLDDMQKERFLFSVHEESVPCWYDDVIFKARSSFRVDATSSQSSIDVKTVSVLGQTFSSRSEFERYLSSRSGRLQFHRNTPINVGKSGCGDPTGCDCGNSVNKDRICSTVTCSSLTCEQPLNPVGHCCGMCGAIVTIQYTNGFNLETYRQRILYQFLTQEQYQSVQLGMSKVSKPQRLLGFVVFSKAVIQVVIDDGGTSTQSEALALDIVKDARNQGANYGILGAELQTSSGGGGEGVDVMVIGIVFGALAFMAIVIVLVIVLVRKGVVRMPSLSSLPTPSIRFRKNHVVGSLDGPLDQGFDNPMFDTPTMMPAIPQLYGADNGISLTQTGVHFVNPAYDEHETDFTA